MVYQPIWACRVRRRLRAASPRALPGELQLFVQSGAGGSDVGLCDVVPASGFGIGGTRGLRPVADQSVERGGEGARVVPGEIPVDVLETPECGKRPQSQLRAMGRE